MPLSLAFQSAPDAGIWRLLAAGILSGGVIAAILGIMFQRRAATLAEEIKTDYQKRLSVFQAERAWKERSVSELLGPMYIQFDRSARAFERWEGRNTYLEVHVIKVANQTIRDLLLTKPHLIPPEVLEGAGKLIEHYDRWLEEFGRLREGQKPDLDAPFVFVGPAGYPFPKGAEQQFKKIFRSYWNDLFAPASSVVSGENRISSAEHAE